MHYNHILPLFCLRIPRTCSCGEKRFDSLTQAERHNKKTKNMRHTHCEPPNCYVAPALFNQIVFSVFFFLSCVTRALWLYRLLVFCPHHRTKLTVLLTRRNSIARENFRQQTAECAWWKNNACLHNRTPSFMPNHDDVAPFTHTAQPSHLTANLKMYIMWSMYACLYRAHPPLCVCGLVALCIYQDMNS